MDLAPHHLQDLDSNACEDDENTGMFVINMDFPLLDAHLAQMDASAEVTCISFLHKVERQRSERPGVYSTKPNEPNCC